MSAQTDTPSVSFLAESAAAVDTDPVQTAVLAIYETRGWTRENKNGQIVPDDDSAKAFVFELFRDNCVINSTPDIVEDGLSRTDLFARTFPTAAGSTATLVDEVQFDAYTRVGRKLWQWAGTGVRSHCQEMAAMEGLDYVMCEKEVFRASRDRTTGAGAPAPMHVRFFTSDADLIFELSAQPAAAKLVKAAEDAEKHLKMNTARHPELIARVAKETRSALRKSGERLEEITNAKPPSAAITAGTGNTAGSGDDA